MLKQFLEQRDAVLAYIRALTGNAAEAEDVFQEVALVVVEEEQRGTQVQNFSAWPSSGTIITAGISGWMPVSRSMPVRGLTERALKSWTVRNSTTRPT